MNIKVDKIKLLSSLKKKLKEMQEQNNGIKKAEQEHEANMAKWRLEIMELISEKITNNTLSFRSSTWDRYIELYDFSFPPPPKANKFTTLDTSELERFITLVSMCTTKEVSLTQLKGIEKYT